MKFKINYKLWRKKKISLFGTIRKRLLSRIKRLNIFSINETKLKNNLKKAKKDWHLPPLSFVKLLKKLQMIHKVESNKVIKSM